MTHNDPHDYANDAIDMREKITPSQRDIVILRPTFYINRETLSTIRLLNIHENVCRSSLCNFADCMMLLMAILMSHIQILGISYSDVHV